jgi:hypothetical protein
LNIFYFIILEAVFSYVTSGMLVATRGMTCSGPGLCIEILDALRWTSRYLLAY